MTLNRNYFHAQIVAPERGELMKDIPFTSKIGQMINIFATIPIDISRAPLQVNTFTIHGHNIENPNAPYRDAKIESNLDLIYPLYFQSVVTCS